MPQSQSVSTADAYTTLHKWLRKVSDHTTRKFVIFRRLMDGGRIIMNQEGDQLVWPILYKLPETRAYTGGPLTFPESDPYRQLSLAPKAMYCSDALDVLTMYRNRGQAALVKRKDRIADNIRQSMQRTLNEAVYYDYDDHPNMPAGLESFLGITAGMAAGDRIGQPDDEYGGVATDLGTLDGTWSDDIALAADQPNITLGYDWPLGSGATEYDATSPMLLNVTSTAWTATSAAVADNLEEVISIGSLWLALNRGDDSAPDLCVLSSDWWSIYEAIQRAKTVINVPHQPGQDVGFRGFNQNGVLVTTEYGVPGTTGYLLNTRMTELDCWTPQLFVPFFNQFELNSLSRKWLALFYGQFGWQPRATAKISAYA